MPSDPRPEPSPPTPAAPARGGGWAPARVLGVVALGVAAVFLLWRGPWRAVQNVAPPASMAAEQVEKLPRGSSDLSLVWMSTRAWLEGENPYTVEGTGRVWAAHAGSPFGPPSERNNALLVYPPSTFVVMAPWCVWDWPRSALLWAGTGTVLLAACGVLSLGLAGLTPGSPVWWFGLAGMLVLAPGGTAVSVGQLSVLAFFLIVLGQAVRAGGGVGGARGVAAGVLLGVACAVKPQVAVLFLAYEFGRKRWTTGLVGVAVAGALLAAGVWQLSRSGVDWVPQWRANLAAFAGSDNANPTAANPLRYHLINLHYLLHAAVPSLSVGAVKLTVYGIIGALAAGYFAADFGKPETRGEALSLSFVAVLAMLVVYHRMYDAVVLLLPLAWVARALAEGRRGPLLIPLAALAVFLVPGASILQSLVGSGRLPAAVAQSWWFQGLAMPHAAAALLVLAGVLLAARARDRREKPAAAATV